MTDTNVIYVALPCGCKREAGENYDIIYKKGERCKIAMHEVDTFEHN